MKKLLFLLTFLGIVTLAMADWNYGQYHFLGTRPQKMMNIAGGVQIWYNGTLHQTHYSNGVEYWEGTGDICVLYPKDYNGRKLYFTSSGGSVQVQYQK